MYPRNESIDDIFRVDASVIAQLDEAIEKSKQSARLVTEEEAAYFFGPNALNYTETRADLLQMILTERKPKKKEERKKEEKTDKKQQKPAHVQYDILIHVSEDRLPPAIFPDPVLDSYMRTQDFKDLEHYLTNVQERKLMPVLQSGRTDLARYGRSDAMAAMLPKPNGAYVVVDHKFRTRAAQQAYRTQMFNPGSMTLEDCAQALEENAVYHETVHRSQDHSGKHSEIDLEHDVEKTLMGFYQNQMSKYQGDPKKSAKYTYLYKIAEQRYKNVEKNYNPLYRAAMNPSKN